MNMENPWSKIKNGLIKTVAGTMLMTGTAQSVMGQGAGGGLDTKAPMGQDAAAHKSVESNHSVDVKTVEKTIKGYEVNAGNLPIPAFLEHIKDLEQKGLKFTIGESVARTESAGESSAGTTVGNSIVKDGGSARSITYFHKDVGQGLISIIAVGVYK